MTPTLPAAIAGAETFLGDLARQAGSVLATLAALDSETRLYDIDIDGSTATLAVEGFVSSEALSSLSSLHLLALSTDALIDLDALLWKPARLRLTQADGSHSVRSGFVQQAEALEADGGLARYALTIVPWLWLATQQTHSRIYQQQRLLSIVEDVFAAYAEHVDWVLAEGVQGFIDALPPRVVCSQYRETDYAFVSRLLREEGLGFFFREIDTDPSPDASTGSSATAASKTQQLVIFCDSSRFAEDRSSASAVGGVGIRFHRASSQQEQDAVQSLQASRSLASASLTTAAWDPDNKRLMAASLGSRPAAGTSAGAAATPLPALERFHWSGHGARITPVELERSAQLSMESIEAAQKSFEGTANVRSFRPGTQFTLTGSPYDQADLFRQQTSAIASGLDASERIRFTLTRVDSAGLNNLPGDLAKAIEALMGRGAAVALGDWGRQLAGHPMADSPMDLPALIAAAKSQGYGCQFQSLRSIIPWRPAGAGERRGATAEGPQSAIVVGIQGAEGNEICRDAQGRIQVRFHWQRGDSAQDQSSGWVRIAHRYAGNRIGTSFVPRIGQEVLVGFVDQDIDQPLVLGALYNGRGETGDAFKQAADRQPSAQGNTRGGQSPAWHGASPDAAGHANAAGFTGFKSQGFGGTGHNQLQLDDHDRELRAQLASTQSASALNLGHLIHTADNHRGSQRGSGFELRTDQSGAIRGGAGVLLTTWHDVQPGSGDPVGDITGPLALLNQAKGLSEAFDTASQTHKTVGLTMQRGTVKAKASVLTDKAAPMAALVKAAGATVDADDDGKALADARQSLQGAGSAVAGSIPHLGASMVVAAGRAGLGLIAGKAIQIATQDSLLMATGGDLNLASGQQLTVHSAQAIGILAGAAKAGEKNLGLTMIAAQGPINVQAQSDTLNIDSEKTLTMLSANASAEFAAATSIKLTTAAGASIEIEGGNITVQCPGTLTVHAAQHQFTGPTQLSREMNAWPETKFDERIKIVYGNGDAAKNYKYEITRADGAKISGVTDADGWTTVQKSEGMEDLLIKLLGPASKSSA